MKISELIAKLEAIKTEHGDLVCATLERDESGGCDGYYDVSDPSVEPRRYEWGTPQTNRHADPVVQLN